MLVYIRVAQSQFKISKILFAKFRSFIQPKILLRNPGSYSMSSKLNIGGISELKIFYFLNNNRLCASPPSFLLKQSL